MPAFMLISGYFFCISCRKSTCLAKTLEKRCISLAVPIAVWSIIGILLSLFTGKVPFQLLPVLKKGIISFIFSLWFLWAIIFCVVLIYLWIHLFCKRRFFIPAVLLLFLLTPDSLNLHLYKYVFPFFLLGFLLNKLIDGDKTAIFLGKIQKHSFLLFAFSFFVCTAFYCRDLYVYNTGITLIGKNIIRQIALDCVRYLFALAGCCVFFYAMIYFERMLTAFPRLKKTVIYLGQKSLGIYILSVVFINEYILLDLGVSNGIAVCLETVFILCISLLFIRVTELSKLASSLLWGKIPNSLFDKLIYRKKLSDP